VATTDKQQYPQSVVDALAPQKSFEVVVETVVGTVEIGTKPGRSPLVVAFEVIGRAVTERSAAMPLRFSFPYADETFRVTVDTDA